jgi:peroxiredoxin
MTAFVIIARIILAAVFAAAGLAKLADRAGTRRAVVEFGAPERFAGALGLLVPVAELAVAALLVPAQTAIYGAIGGLVLLAVFSAAIAWNLARGRTPDCHCFGQLHSAPAGWRTLGRNAVLALVALVALVGAVNEPDASATAWIADLGGPELLALAVAVSAVVLLSVGAFAFLSLMRSYGRVLVRLDRVEAALADAGIDFEADETIPEIGLEPGTPAPEFSLTSTRGETVTLDSLTAAGVPALLVFTSPRCGPCATLLPTAAGWQRDYADELTVAFLSNGSHEEIRAEAEEHELEHVLLDDDGTVSETFEASGTPSAVLIAADGTIASWVASGSQWIERLVAETTAGAPEDEGLPLGAEAPAIELPTLDGEPLSLAELRGHNSLLLFWNPSCGFCRAMHEDLLAFERSANGVTPRLVVISSGDAESTREEGFQSLVLLDEGFAAGSSFAANGTPMAVLLDADGRVASRVVAGADAVLELAGANGQ